MNILIIPFVCYGSELINNLLSDYHLSKVHKMNVDKIYFTGDRMGFKNETIDLNNKKIVYLNTIGVWHQSNIESVIKELNEEDKFIIMDSDLMIYDYSIFDDIFDWLNEYDIVSNLDAGTTIMPTWTWEKDYDVTKEDNNKNLMYNIEIMRPKSYRGGRTRFAATLFGCKVNFYRKYNSLNPDSKFESMEEFSRNVAKYCPQVKVKELLDFRNSLYCNGNYDGNQNPNLSLKEILNLPNMKDYYSNMIGEILNNNDTRCTHDLFKNSKYYHIRNIGGSIRDVVKIIENKNTNPTDFHYNPVEGIRLLSWLHILIEKMSLINEKYKSCTMYSQKILEYYGIPNDFFQIYLEKTKQFHRTHLL